MADRRETAEIGLIGLGTMGANLALNIAETGHKIAVWNRTRARTEAFAREADDLAAMLVTTVDLSEFVAAIARPRRIVLMVPAGKPVDDQIAALLPLVDAGDVIVDAGNSDWQDTDRRAAALAREGIEFLGLGVSGGAEGARNGPSMMAGGSDRAWAALAPVLQVVAARFEHDPCVAHLGPGGAGHYVKMVHNGIEYADMQMIAEVYGLMRDGMGQGAAAIGDGFARWNEGPLASYLIEITAEVAGSIDPDSGHPMLDLIVDRAGQKGTGRWTVIDAQMRAAPLPAVEAAVTARVLSGEAEARAEGAAIFGEAGAMELPERDLESALMAGKILAYSQGFSLLATASAEQDWSLPLPRIAEIWRAGCIIRSAMLGDMARALAEAPDARLAFAPDFAVALEAHVPGLRRVVAAATLAGLPVPALASSLGYFDTLRQARGTANLIQGLRDRFGAHGFERTDRPGARDLHGPWG
ncbi:NADP-dependent phosphogluconate dehydrogenase [Roseicyclus mahoneyensis]|uniref:6-phosphogluconate dehydrogenase, decarboxylating n=1 Tax=Roseicyclus mahoneyensis TaxID=164332 RepID=A0A316G8P6_9RHOB|nr:NADP-dependent phosphogluconate dehydrogenase [Roseicyclus mahoneyensis]PWK57351.1 6-phosphogluconate dehydrogenase (decarboxylating) [Roseicyclus mahoneyensis]